MPKKKNVEEPATDDRKEEPLYTARQLAASVHFADVKDIVSAVSVEGRSYTVSEMEKLVCEFKKGKVN